MTQLNKALFFLALVFLLNLAYLYYAPSYNTVQQPDNPGFQCQSWAVVSLHQHQAPPAAHFLGHWCLLVLVDESPETPSTLAGWYGVQYLDRTWYQNSCRFGVCSLQNWGDVRGRRNLGYLYALQHGAHRLMDLDDSVEMVSPPPSLPAFLPVTYPAALVWSPGGEELNSVREQVPCLTVSVLQSHEGQPSLVVIGQRIFLPPTSPASLYLQDSLWTLLLPGSSAGRRIGSLVKSGGDGGCGAARGWLAQKLLWRLENAGSVAVGPAWVVASKEGGEKQAEQEILPPGKIMDVELKCDSARSCMIELYSSLVGDNSSCLSIADMPLVANWFNDLEALGYIPPKLRRRRSFAYLTQGGELTPTAVPRLRGAKPGDKADYDTFYLSFRTRSGDLFFPNSTFQQGRNALLRLALARQVEPGYDYFIFTDEDVTLRVENQTPQAYWKQKMAVNAWQRFEEFLHHFQPKIGHGLYKEFEVAKRPYSIQTDYDECMIAYHRSVLEFGVPLLESPLDWLSSWNQGYLRQWFIKIFYSNSVFQCNSVRSINGGTKYHVAKDLQGGYAYKQGHYIKEVQSLIREHIDLTAKNNALLTLFKKFVNIGINGNGRNGKLWGKLHLEPEMFNLNKSKQIGFGFQLETFQLFNICGQFFQAQAKWWKSGICYYLRSKKLTTALVKINESCEKQTYTMA